MATLGMLPESTGTLWDKYTPASGALELPKGITHLRTLHGHTSWIGRIAWSPDGRFIASPSNDATVRVWNAKAGECLHILSGHRDTVCTAAFDRNSRIVATASEDRTLKFWDVSTGRLIRTLETQTINYGVAFDPKGRVLATSGQGGIQLWDASGQLLEILEKRQHSLFPSVAFDSDGQVLACASSDDSIYLFELPSCRLFDKFTDHDSPVNSVEFNSQGDLLISGSADKTLMLWDIREGRLLRTFEGHTGEAYCASFSRTSALIASKGGDAVRLWNPHDGSCLTIPISSYGVWFPGLSFHPTKNILATVGSAPGVPAHTEQCDRVIHIWKVGDDLSFS